MFVCACFSEILVIYTFICVKNAFIWIQLPPAILIYNPDGENRQLGVLGEGHIDTLVNLTNVFCS